MAKQVHPDAPNGDEKSFIDVNEAYHTLIVSKEKDDEIDLIIKKYRDIKNKREKKGKHGAWEGRKVINRLGAPPEADRKPSGNHDGSCLKSKSEKMTKGVSLVWCSPHQTWEIKKKSRPS